MSVAKHVQTVTSEAAHSVVATLHYGASMPKVRVLIYLKALNVHASGYHVLKKWLSCHDNAILGHTLSPEEVRTFTAIYRHIAALLAQGPELGAHYRAAVDSGSGV